MRKTLSVILIFIATSSFSQTEYFLKSHQANADDTVVYQYKYNPDFSLKSILRMREDDTTSMRKYEGDTLVRTIGSAAISSYNYYDDSITRSRWINGDSAHESTHFLDISDHVLHTIFQNNSIENIYNVWEGENIIEQSYTLFGDLTEYSIEYHQYLNPLYNENKYLRTDVSSSYNFVKSFVDPLGVEFKHLEVIETLGNYPTIVDVYIYGVYSHSILYEYYTISTVTEVPQEADNVLSIDYYDLSGRTISKPQFGLYIECKTTNKGVVCKKYFLMR